MPLCGDYNRTSSDTTDSTSYMSGKDSVAILTIEGCARIHLLSSMFTNSVLQKSRVHPKGFPWAA